MKHNFIIPLNIIGLVNLEELNLSWNDIQNINETFFNDCTNLKNVNLGNNELTTVPNLTSSKFLTHLYLGMFFYFLLLLKSLKFVYSYCYP